MIIRTLLLTFLWGFTFSVQAQYSRHKVELRNASFEAMPAESALPMEWTSCGSTSSPDILPGPWGVHLAPQSGISYVGLVVRDDNSQEYIVQELSEPLKAGTCYTFTVNLATSLSYAGYENPTRLRIWGSNSPCKKEALLGTSENISTSFWTEQEVGIYTETSYKYIILECYYKQPALFFYNGNLLIDNISVLLECERV